MLRAHKTNSKLVAVVPLSTTRPMRVEDHHYRLLQNPLPDEAAKEVWVKCDMIAIVSTERLDMIRSGKGRADGKREYLRLQLGAEQFEAIRRGVVAGLGLMGVIATAPPPSVTTQPSNAGSVDF